MYCWGFILTGAQFVGYRQNYVADRMVGERRMIKNNLHTFFAEPVSFEWYGAATSSKYGAS